MARLRADASLPVAADVRLELEPTPVTLGGATGWLAFGSLAASIIPARRAANVLPMTALRND